MKRFLLGVLTTLVVLVLGVIVLGLSLGSGATPAALPSPPPSGVRVSPPGDLGPDETWLGAVRLQSREVLAAEGDLVDVDATGTGVRFGPDGLRATTLAVRATLPFGTVAEQVGAGTRLYAAGEGRAGVERQVNVLGRDLLVRATGRVRAEGGLLVLEPETVDVGGPGPVDAALGAAARQLVTIRTPVTGLPDGMVLREVGVDGAGFAVRLDGQDVVLGR
ncbi:LmeA family phospholipid-binding protein [Arthrobacter sp. NEB 688]|uniref:LmeA family phospholipid-binding protein n=1 Tax=Arthrobacter sp. NEB 688 TaxID=904039 RepID=UPI001565C8DE|nr:LmeA family phospholipid-binding protein [Arthrobacter sp. NEB 688]QKE83875.1 hypothetical protein HL663_07940 [Arthrobacter sp. NEB 688]